MTINEAKEFAEAQLAIHGCSDWKVKITRGEAFSLGGCIFDSKTLTLSRRHVENDTEETVRDTILHEVAHVRAGSEKPYHGAVWKEFARSMGAIPKAKKTVSLPPPKLKAKCAKCLGEFKRYRKPPSQRYCAPCYRRGTIELLEWEKFDPK
jgi:predicted SprT family Zn-dependent metalloprotease